MSLRNDEIRVLIVDDESVIALTLEDILTQMGIGKVEIALFFEEAVEIAQTLKPHLLLFDINLKTDQDGIELAAQIKKDLNTEVIYITAHFDDDTITRAKKTQPLNYIIKPFEAQQVKLAMEMAINQLGDGDETGREKLNLSKLITQQELEILRLIANGRSSDEIAGQLFISPKTVMNHRYNIAKKLQLPAEKNNLLKWAIENKGNI